MAYHSVYTVKPPAWVSGACSCMLVYTASSRVSRYETRGFDTELPFNGQVLLRTSNRNYSPLLFVPWTPLHGVIGPGIYPSGSGRPPAPPKPPPETRHRGRTREVYHKTTRAWELLGSDRTTAIGFIWREPARHPRRRRHLLRQSRQSQSCWPPTRAMAQLDLMITT